MVLEEVCDGKLFLREGNLYVSAIACECQIKSKYQQNQHKKTIKDIYDNIVIFPSHDSLCVHVKECYSMISTRLNLHNCFELRNKVNLILKTSCCAELLGLSSTCFSEGEKNRARRVRLLHKYTLWIDTLDMGLATLGPWAAEQLGSPQAEWRNCRIKILLSQGRAV